MYPEITVLMSVCNGEKYLRQSIDSILSQTYSDFEFLIIDDGSTDLSRDIVVSYDDQRIRLIQNKTTLGQTACLNNGLTISNAKYIARIDQDDISLPGRLERQVSFLNEHPGTVLLGSWVDIIDEANNILMNYEIPTNECEISNFFIQSNFTPFPHSSVVFHRDTVEELGGYPSTARYSQDALLFMKIIRQHPFAIIPEILVQIRNHETQQIRSRDLLRIRESIEYYNQALQLPYLSKQSIALGNNKLIRQEVFYATRLLKLGRTKVGKKMIIQTVRKTPLIAMKYLMKFTLTNG